MPTNNETLISVTGSVTHDESDGLQVGGVATATEDNNDNDVANLSALQTNAAALYDRLFTAGGLNLTPPASVNGGGQAVAQVITITNGAGLNDLKFTDASGNGLNGAASGLSTVNGDAILLYTDTNNNIVLGKTAGGDVIFALVLEELKNASNVVTGGKIWIVQFEALDHGANLSHDNALDLTNKLYVTGTSEVLFGNFDDAPANQNAWTAVDNDATSTSDVQLLVTGQNVIQQGSENDSYGDTVNTRATSLGSNNQAVNPGEALRFDTVTGIVVPIGSKAADFTQSIAYGDHSEVTGLGVTLVQTTPSAAVQTVQVSIWDVQADTAQGNTFVGGLDTSATGDANNDRVNIGSVEIRNAANQTVEWRAVDGTLLGGTNVAAINFTFGQSTNGINTATNQATITGLTVGMQIIVRSASGEVFDRMLVANVGANAFDLGGIRLLDAAGDTDEVGSQIRFEDDGPAVTLGLNAVDPIAVDETALGIAASDGGATLASTPDFGSDGDGGSSFSLDDPNATNSGLVDVATGAAVLLDKTGDDVVGYVNGGGTTAFDDAADTEVFRISIGSVTGELTLNQSRAIVHDDETDDNDSKSMGPGKVFASVTVADGDDDTATDNVDISGVFAFLDDGPTATIAVNATPQLQVDDTTLSSDDTETDPYATSPSDDGGADGADTPVLTYSFVDVAAGTATGLFASAGGGAIVLDKVGDDLVGYVNGGGGAGFDNAADVEVFRLSIDSGTGQVTLDQKAAIKHDDGAEDTNDFQESDDATDGDPDTNLQQLTGPYIQVVATITDGDGDSFTTDPDTATVTVNFLDDGPSITAPFDADPVAGGIQTPETLGNAVGQTASGVFGYDLGADGQSGGSDFVDANGALANVQLSLTGTVDNAQNPNITQAVVTRSAETATSASFNFSFHFDKDPITAGVQDATAAGTLVFDKTNDTYTFTLSDVIDGFGFDVLHTSELLRKEPPGNTGQPKIVVTELDLDSPGAPADGFYVQFTGNTLTQAVPTFGFNATGDGAPVAGDTTFNNGQFVTNNNEDWVSATQATNGVAGDTIQKSELLTLRFFGENILGDVATSTEKVDPTTTAAGIVIKFDGIGASEDLVLILHLKDANGNETTRAVNVQNSDLVKGNANIPAPYNTEFTLDNNDALLIIESNDFNAAGETYQIQGVQIMQSANGLTGTAINLNGATGAGGSSNATGSLTAWDPLDNDVLKIVDIGFVQNTSGQLDASLDFALTLRDGDNDLTTLQHLLLSISNDYIV